jgi:hypothetical protein
VVVSRFVRYLEEFVAPAIRADAGFAGVGVVRFTGDTSEARRAQVLHDFASDPTQRVLLLGLQAGGVGLNLVSASLIILCDQATYHIPPHPFPPSLCGLMLDVCMLCMMSVCCV